jgi:hypothetical protein
MDTGGEDPYEDYLHHFVMRHDGPFLSDTQNHFRCLTCGETSKSESEWEAAERVPDW